MYGFWLYLELGTKTYAQDFLKELLITLPNMYNGVEKEFSLLTLSVSFDEEELDHPKIKYFKNMKLWKKIQFPF